MIMILMVVVTWQWDDEPTAKACEWARSKACCAFGGTPVLVCTQSDDDDVKYDADDENDDDDDDDDGTLALVCTQSDDNHDIKYDDDDDDDDYDNVDEENLFSGLQKSFNVVIEPGLVPKSHSVHFGPIIHLQMVFQGMFSTNNHKICHNHHHHLITSITRDNHQLYQSSTQTAFSSHIALLDRLRS